MRRLLVTGSRHGWDEDRLHEALEHAHTILAYEWDSSLAEEVTLVHGDAPGVDTQAKDYWLSRDRPVEDHHADWLRFGPAAGPIRNTEMVDLGADLCLAFGDGRGTTDCALKAEAAGITVYWERER